MKYFVSLNSSIVSKEERLLLLKESVAGVVLFGKNIKSYQTTANLIRDIKKIRGDLLIAIDEEGGFVSRFTHLIPNYSQPYTKTIRAKDAREYYKMRSEFLVKIGIDINFAPVVDLVSGEDDFMYKRSFGDDKNKVVEMATICLEEQRRAKIKSCLKHFPGHGFTTVDSHVDLPTVDMSMKDWLNGPGEVFRQLVNLLPEYIMTAHVVYPQIDTKPGTVSPLWVKEILREKFAFAGQVISDDITMKGLAKTVNTADKNLFENVGLDFLIITDQNHPFLQENK